MHTIKLLFFATLRDQTGLRETEFDIPAGTTVQALKKLVGDRFQAARQTLNTALVSVNKEFAFDQDEIPPGAEVAIFPPVSGG